jgi:hypothetical protein
VNFIAADVVTTGGVLSNFTGSGRNYTATYTRTGASIGTVRVSVPAGRFTDAFGNGNLAGTLSVGGGIFGVVPASSPAPLSGASPTMVSNLSDVSASIEASKLTLRDWQ